MLIELLVRVITSPYLVEYSLLVEVSFVVIKEKKNCIFLLRYRVRIYVFDSRKQGRQMAENCDIEYRVVATTDARHLGYIFLYGIIAPIME